MSSSWDHLIDDVHSLIKSLLSPVPRYCFARTCKSEWDSWRPKVKFNRPNRASLVVQGRTPLNVVRAWMKAIATCKHAVARADFCKGGKLCENLAREGWSREELETIELSKETRWHYYMDFRQDLVLGYLRGGHMHLFTPLWDTVRVIQALAPRNRSHAMFRSRLAYIAAETNQFTVFRDLTHRIALRALRDDDNNLHTASRYIISMMFRVAHADFCKQWLAEDPGLKRKWDKMLLNSREVNHLLGKMETRFDHRLAEMLLPHCERDALPPRVFCQWTTAALESGNLSALQWLHEHGYFRREEFDGHLWGLLLDVHKGNVDRTLLELYFTANPCSEFLVKHGYYKSPHAHEVRAYYPYLPEVMCQWLEKHVFC